MERKILREMAGHSGLRLRGAVQLEDLLACIRVQYLVGVCALL